MLFVRSAHCEPVMIEMEQVNNLIQGIFQKRNHARRDDIHEYMYKCATPIIYYALKNSELLWPENRLILYRPDNPSFLRYYSPDALLDLTYNTPEGHFKIHYSESGKDAVFGSDGNTSTIPDYVIKFGSYFEKAWDYETNPNMLGYKPPPPDGNNGGDNRFDIYIMDISYYGYTDIDDNGHPYIVVNKDYTFYKGNFDPEGYRFGNMKVTAAHEFFHAIQYFYDDWNDGCLWWEENTAVWMEDEVFDLVDDYLRYIPDRLLNMDIPLDDERSPNSLYGGVIWAKFLSETYGKNIIRHIFERLYLDASLAKDAIGYTLQNYNSNWSEALKQFCLKNLTLDYEEGNKYLFYSTADTFTDIIHNKISSADIETGYSALGLNNKHLSCKYFKFIAETPVESIRINLTSQGIISPITLFVADQNITGDPIWDANNVHFWPFMDMEFVLNEFSTSSTYPRAYLIVINPNPDSDNCLYYWTADFYPPMLQTPVIHYPVSGQIIIFNPEYPLYTITLSVKNLPNDPLNPNRKLEYIFELYKSYNLSLVDSQIIPEDSDNPNGISSCQIILNNKVEDSYYWRCRARIVNTSDRSFWTPLSSFYHQVLLQVLLEDEAGCFISALSNSNYDNI